MPELDRLIINIETNAKGSYNAIGKFADNIGKVATAMSGVDTSKMSTLASGMSRLSTAMHGMQSVGTADFTRLIKNVNRLNTIDTSKISTVSASIRNIGSAFSGLTNLSKSAEQLTALASGISKLGYKSSANAIENIPRLATALKSLMTTLSTAPKVSQNLIQMTNALANFSSQGARVGAASNSITRGINLTSTASKHAGKSYVGLASKIGKLYASYFWITRIIKAFKSSIESTADYLEAFNYFEVALNKIGKDSEKQYAKYGYNSAEEYANSFNTRLQQKIHGLSGLSLEKSEGETGLLRPSKTNSLGLNITEVTQYASQLASVTNSVGQLGEVSIQASSAFTKLGADMSSLFNLNYSDVMKNLQSGLIGQSRAMYKYGIDITNATLSTYAYNLGVKKSVSEMTQMEKMQLRMIAILDQSKVSWGDLANTINSPSNMMRQFKNNMTEVSMVIGQLFMPIMQKVLPVINGIAIALKSMFTAMAGALGIKLDLSTFGQTVTDIEDDVDDASDSVGDLSSNLGDVADNLKKIKAGARSFDELTVIKNKDTSTSSSNNNSSNTGNNTIDLSKEIEKATQAYEKAWEEAYKNMENKSEKWANMFIDTFKKGDFESVGSSISTKLMNALDKINWSSVYEKAGKFGSGLASFLNGLFEGKNGETLFGKVGETIAGALNTRIQSSLSFAKTFNFTQFGTSIADGINTFFEKFNFKAMATTLNTWAKGLWKALSTAVKKIKWSSIFKGIFDFFDEISLGGMVVAAFIPKLRKLASVALVVSGKFAGLVKNLILVRGAFIGNSTAIATLGASFPKLTALANTLGTAFQQLFFGIHYKNFSGGLNLAMTTLRQNLTNVQKGAITAIAAFAEFKIVSDSAEDLASGCEDVGLQVGKIALTVAAAATAMYVAFGPAGLAMAAVVGLVAAVKGISDAFKKIEAQKYGDNIKNALSKPGGVSITELSTKVTESITKIGSSFEKLSKKSEELDTAESNIEDIWTQIEIVRTKMKAGVMSVEEGTKKLNSLFSELATAVEEKFGKIQDALILAFGEGGAFEKFGDSVEENVYDELMAVLGVTEKTKNRSLELIKLMSNPNISTKDYVKYKNEFFKINGVTDDVTTATNEFQNAILDMSELLNDDGTISEENLEKALSSISTAYSDAEAKIDASSKEIIKQLQDIYDNAETQKEKNAVKKLMDSYTQAVENAKATMKNQATGFTNSLQINLIDGIDDIIEKAGKDWEKMNWWERLWSSAETKEDYMKKAVEKYAKDMGTLSDKIESSYKNLGIKGAGWAKSAGEKIIGKLFKVDEYKVDYLTTYYSTVLKGDYKKFLNDTTDGLEKDMQTKGQNIVDGFFKGVDSKKTVSGTPVESWSKAVDSFLTSFWDIHSPSKKTKKMGENVVQGFNKGISGEKESSKKSASTWVDEVFGAFDKITGKISGTWKDLKTSTKTVFTQLKDVIKKPINSIIKCINSMISGVVTGINTVIESLNGIKIDIPDWVPKYGGKKFGFDLKKIKPTQIPMLANGAVFDGGNPYLAIVNDQPRGQTNIEAPLKTIQTALRQEMYRGGMVNGDMKDVIYNATYNAVYNAMSNSEQNNNIHIQMDLDGEPVYRNVIQRSKNAYKQNSNGRLVTADELYAY